MAAGTVVPVGITLYGLRQKFGYDLAARLTSMAPSRQLFKIDDYGSFREPFLELLESRWSWIQRELAALKEAHDDKPIVLLCFDRVDRSGDWCHRQVVAEFLASKLGQPVEELGLSSIPAARSSVDQSTLF